MTPPPASETERELAAEIVRLSGLVEYWKATATDARELAAGHAETLREVKKALGISWTARRREILDAIRRVMAAACGQ